MTAEELSRRRLLGALGAATAVFAGCSSGGSTAGSPSGSDSHGLTSGPSTTGSTTRPPTGRPSSGDDGDTPTRTRPLQDATTRDREPGPVTPDSPAAAWQFDLGRRVAAPPGVHDGTVYAGTAGAEATTPGGEDPDRSHRHLFALAADGTERWRYETVHNVASQPVVVEDTVVYITGASGMMVTSGWGATGLTTDGERRWRVDARPAEVLATDDSTVYLGEYDGQYGTDAFPPSAVRALDPGNGRERWRRGFGKFESVAVREDTLYVGTARSGASEAGLFAVDARTGSERWSRPGFLLRSVTDDGLFGYDTATQPGRLTRLGFDGSERWAVGTGVSAVFAVGSERVFAAAEDALVAYDVADGSRRWRVEFGLGWHPTARFADGTLYVTSGTGDLLALAPDGRKRWRRSVSATHLRAVTATDRTVLVELPNELAALATADGTTRWRLDTPGGVRGPALAGNRAYVAAGRGDVFALALE